MTDGKHNSAVHAEIVRTGITDNADEVWKFCNKICGGPRNRIAALVGMCIRSEGDKVGGNSFLSRYLYSMWYLRSARAASCVL